MSATTTYILLHDDKEIYRHEDEEQVYKHLQIIQPQSMSYATTYGGYKVIWWMDDFKPIGATQESRTKVNNFGDTSHNHSTAVIKSVPAPEDSELDTITTIVCECGFDALDELRLKKVEDGENASDTSE
jgi:hypothetical protein